MRPGTNASAICPNGALADKKVLVFVVAYNAEKTIGSVLQRIPAPLRNPAVEVLVIDDSSHDETFAQGLRAEAQDFGFNLTVLKNPVNQGYGGNQKLGYRYAIEHGFDVVALLHGDGQYAPEKLPELLQPLLNDDADAVFGSRMLTRGAARRGGMPLYKWWGNKILTAFQNRMLRTSLSEFHSGYRLYSVKALRRIPFESNTNNFHFDTEIIIQLLLAKCTIRELPIPTYYGDEICHVNGLKYAWDVVVTTLRSRIHQMNLLYDRRFDVEGPSQQYDLKLGFPSSHTSALERIRKGSKVLDLGCGPGELSQEMAVLGAEVTALDAHCREEQIEGVRFLRWDLNQPNLPVAPSQFDQIFLLDVIEHLHEPEEFMDRLRYATGLKRPEIVLTTGNIGFFVIRLMLLMGKFNYGKKGILDRTHTRLFTFRSLIKLLRQGGYDVTEVRGIPAPFPKAIGLNAVSRFLLGLNRFLIHLSRGLFAYQILVVARAQPTVHHLLEETVESSALLRKTVTDSKS